MLKIVMSVVTTALFCCQTGSAEASPSGAACPGGNTGFVLWDVTTEPYGVDNLVDQRGNQDGWACAMPIKVVTDEEGNPFQIYNFLDNKFH